MNAHAGNSPSPGSARGGFQITVSVALCAYNGERYLGEQLRSIAAQTRLPDDLVICDDGSTDGTAAIVQEFARRAMFPVRFFVNDRNLGIVKNFERAISLCEGEIIALADQDDVWLPDKLAEFEAVFASRTDTSAVFADATVVDEVLQPLGYTLWGIARFSEKEFAEVNAGEAVRVLLRHNVVQGAAMAFRADLRPLILPLVDGVMHDAWIALLAAVAGPVRGISRPLILYRQHGENQLGSKRHGLLERMRGSCLRAVAEARTEQYRYEQARQRLRARSPAGATPALLEDIAAKADHLACRINVALRKKGWVSLLLTEVMRGRYHRYSRGWWSLGRDLIKCTFNRGSSALDP